MITERAHGVKRKLNEVDGGGDLQVRCLQRETVFNISICKLQKSSACPEPVLCRTVLISNTIRLIKEDIEEERKTLETVSLSRRCDGKTWERGRDTNERLQTGSTRSRENLEGFVNSLTFEQELSILGDKMVRELELDAGKSCLHELSTRTKMGSVTQNLAQSSDSNNNTIVLSSEGRYEKISNSHADEMVREITCGSLLGLELTEELEFKDVDVSLYDFDVSTGSFPIDFEEFCTTWNLGTTSVASRSLPARCSDSVKLELRTTEHSFDELDQVMQILVGS